MGFWKTRVFSINNLGMTAGLQSAGDLEVVWSFECACIHVH